MPDQPGPPLVWWSPSTRAVIAQIPTKMVVMYASEIPTDAMRYPSPIDPPPDGPPVDSVLPTELREAAYRTAEAGGSFTLFGRRYAPVGYSADQSLRADNAQLRHELALLRGELHPNDLTIADIQRTFAPVPDKDDEDAPLHEMRCPSCNATIRARMADAPTDEQDQPAGALTPAAHQWQPLSWSDTEEESYEFGELEARRMSRREIADIADALPLGAIATVSIAGLGDLRALVTEHTTTGVWLQHAAMRVYLAWEAVQWSTDRQAETAATPPPWPTGCSWACSEGHTYRGPCELRIEHIGDTRSMLLAESVRSMEHLVGKHVGQVVADCPSCPYTEPSDGS